MATRTKETTRELQASIFKKLGYAVEFQEFDIDEETGDEDEDSEDGYYWVDSCGNGTQDLYADEDDAIEDCLANIDLKYECKGAKLTKEEKAWILKEHGVKVN